MHVGQRPEKRVDGDVAAFRSGRASGHAQIPVVHRQRRARGYHIDVITLDRDRLGDLRDRDDGAGLQNPVKDAFVIRGQVHHHDEGHAGLGRHMRKKCFKRVDPPS